MSAVIAIVGRPNVGKSALFNRLAGRRIAIVHDQPGVTRDRVTAEAEWKGRPFTLVDTGGIGLLRGEKADDIIVQAALQQVQLAIDSAHVVLLVVDAQAGLMPLDQEVAARLREARKPVIVVANKADHQGYETASVEFSALGFDDLVAVSALHGRGISALMQLAMQKLEALGVLPPPAPAAALPKEEPLKIAIVGRPNVGKSSLINALTRSERVIVSPVPGTTRDAVDVPFAIETDGVRQPCILIDTAGIRKKRRLEDSVEFFSVDRAEASIARCDIAVLVLDAEAGITEQDKKIADLITEHQRACVLVVNKWDLFQDRIKEARREHRPGQTPSRLDEFAAWVQERMFFLDYAPVIFTSAVSGFHLERLLEAIRYVAAQWRQRVPTAVLNRVLAAAVERKQPISNLGHHLKFFYATQVEEAPPTFVLFVNRDELLSDPYKKYLAGELRKAFGYEGCPLILRAKPRPRSVPPKRTEKSPRSRPRRRH
ncbi:ribosome biogenesis GTPase Der [Fontisphaera persica]|uniref:ribosome biogenesis GTPase Der n=1 Tax=Fontisphaera persica TaxID=2974023 RepID=UPI0024BF165D|nr:ribosome biogenesis GTPase Der [Fontisphaera persica]WCJ60053.1 ribosome biogenesis GTPase Der [Fontisphaera persica]